MVKISRKLILNNKLVLYMDLAGESIFNDATVDPCVIAIKKGNFRSENKIFSE